MNDRIDFDLQYRSELPSGWYITSKDVKGLFFWAPNLHKLADGLPQVVNKLIELNKLSDVPAIKAVHVEATEKTANEADGLVTKEGGKNEG